MQHWNGNQVAVIDIETGGLDPYYHEILQICILALDSEFKPRKDVLPFYIEMVPQHLERVDPEAMSVNKLDLAKIVKRGIDPEKAKDLLIEWFNKLGLPYTVSGARKRIIPLGQNYGSFDKPFISQWLGPDLYKELFDYHHRDTMCSALFINDHAAVHAESVPFPKVNLTYLATTLKIDHEGAHDALRDCLTCAEVYRQMTQRGMIA